MFFSGINCKHSSAYESRIGSINHLELGVPFIAAFNLVLWHTKIAMHSQGCALGVHKRAINDGGLYAFL
jgi:hypothetical protein